MVRTSKNEIDFKFYIQLSFIIGIIAVPCSAFAMIF